MRDIRRKKAFYQKVEAAGFLIGSGCIILSVAALNAMDANKEFAILLVPAIFGMITSAVMLAWASNRIERMNELLRIGHEKTKNALGAGNSQSA